MSPKKSVLIAEDHAIFREGLRALLEQNGGFDILAETDNGQDALSLAFQYVPDLAILDISMRIINGTEVVPQLKRRLPETKVIVLTMHKAEEYVRAALAAGVDGYVLKDDSQSELLCAIDKVFDGQTYLSAGICTQVVTGFLANGPEAGARDGSCSWASLTVREREVLKLVADGKRNKEIAECLSLSVKTVEKHRVNLMKKLDVRNASELTAFAMKNGLI
jgi:DNA-binding NarL/FixJ family response regulator